MNGSINTLKLSAQRKLRFQETVYLRNPAQFIHLAVYIINRIIEIDIVTFCLNLIIQLAQLIYLFLQPRDRLDLFQSRAVLLVDNAVLDCSLSTQTSIILIFLSLHDDGENHGISLGSLP